MYHFQNGGYGLTHTHGPLTRYVKLRVAHATGMPGTFSPPPWVSYPDMHRGTCGTHVPWCMPGLLISGFLWSRWRGKRSWHSRRMRNPEFCVSGKRPIAHWPLSHIRLYTLCNAEQAFFLQILRSSLTWKPENVSCVNNCSRGTVPHWLLLWEGGPTIYKGLTPNTVKVNLTRPAVKIAVNKIDI